MIVHNMQIYMCVYDVIFQGNVKIVKNPRSLDFFSIFAFRVVKG